MRLVRDIPRSAEVNIALEEILTKRLARGSSPETLRLWVNPPCVVLGRFQRLKDSVNIEFCRKFKLPVFRRVSGGGTIYQDYGNLNISFYILKDTLGTKWSVKESYKLFCGIIVKALKKLGFNASHKPPGDVLVNGKKVSGSAQFRVKNAILHHSTLMLKVNLKRLGNVLKIENPEKILANINLERKKAEKIIIDTALEELNVNFEIGNITNSELKEVNEFLKIKRLLLNF